MNMVWAVKDSEKCSPLVPGFADLNQPGDPNAFWAIVKDPTLSLHVTTAKKIDQKDRLVITSMNEPDNLESLMRYGYVNAEQRANIHLFYNEIITVCQQVLKATAGECYAWVEVILYLLYS